MKLLLLGTREARLLAERLAVRPGLEATLSLAARPAGRPLRRWPRGWRSAASTGLPPIWNATRSTG